MSTASPRGCAGEVCERIAVGAAAPQPIPPQSWRDMARDRQPALFHTDAEFCAKMDEHDAWKRERQRGARKGQLATAYHEAGHAVVALRLGWPVAGVHVDRFACVRFEPFRGGEDVSPAAHIAMLFAGPIAGGWSQAELASLGDEDLAFYIGKTGTGCAGACDHCRIVGHLRAEHLNADAAALTAAYRRHEEAALSLLSDPVIWQAVRRIAADLLEVGELDGAQTREIAALPAA